MMLGKLEEVHGSESNNGNMRPSRNSLRDRFKLLRMREEAGITTLDEEDSAGHSFTGFGDRVASLGLGLTSPTSEQKGVSSALASPIGPIPPSPNPATNPSMTPGTAAGVFAGPSSMTNDNVDWDLWQSVVNEGPAAVARTSAGELNSAIATGIPSAIRGVVWQVLAQSKNEDLESVYRDLLIRGTDKDVEKSGSSVSVQSHTSPKETDVVSSASSIHSETSTPATTVTNGLRSPSPPKDTEAQVKAQAVSIAQKKKQAKEDEAAIKKLEKAIKRDLGARTSFSKFAASAGLQDGLFGVCKAYALFDEGVGYAQGMNFLVMPLLFNVSLNASK